MPIKRRTSSRTAIIRQASLLEYPEDTEPRFSDECARLKPESYDFWYKRAREFHKEGEFNHALACEAKAYTCHDNEAFLRYCQDILRFRDVKPAFHMRFIPYMTGLVDVGKRGERRSIDPYRMCLVFRGSLKSSLMNGMASWRIAQSTVEHNWDECTTRIVMGSEKIALAKQNVSAVRTIVDSPAFALRFGRHKPQKRTEGSWGNEMFTSRLQKALYTRDPTVFTMSLSVDRTGFHCNHAILDDLQARSSTYNIEQIEKAYELYRLVHSILDPETDDEYTEMLLGGTTWHFDDVYARIEAESKKTEIAKDALAAHLETHHPPLNERSEISTPSFKIIKIAAEEWQERIPNFDPHNGRPLDLHQHVELRLIEGTHSKTEFVRTATWPERLPLKKLDEIKGHQGNEIYNAQYLLDPIPAADRTFLRKDLRYRDVGSDEKLFANPYFVLIGGDPAWMSQESVRAREGISTANSVLVAVAIDPAYTLHILSIYRQKAAVPEFTDELWRLHGAYKNQIAVGLQQYDYKHLAPEFKRKFMETKKMPNIKWVSSGGGREDRPDKNDRIRAKLSGLWSAHKILLPRGFPEVEEEFFDFPKGKRKDFLDALANVVEIMLAPTANRADESRRQVAASIIDSVESGSPFGPSDKTFRDAY